MSKWSRVNLARELVYVWRGNGVVAVLQFFRFSCLVFFPVLMSFLTHLHTLLDNVWRVFLASGLRLKPFYVLIILFWQLLCSHNSGWSQMLYTESNIYLWAVQQICGNYNPATSHEIVLPTLVIRYPLLALWGTCQCFCPLKVVLVPCSLKLCWTVRGENGTGKSFPAPTPFPFFTRQFPYSQEKRNGAWERDGKQSRLLTVSRFGPGYSRIPSRFRLREFEPMAQ
jgi:hypothetical protein